MDRIGIRRLRRLMSRSDLVAFIKILIPKSATTALPSTKGSAVTECSLFIPVQQTVRKTPAERSFTLCNYVALIILPIFLYFNQLFFSIL